MALGEPRSFKHSAFEGNRGFDGDTLNDLRKEVSSGRRKDIGLFLLEGVNTSQANLKVSAFFDLIEGCKGRYDVAPSDVFA